MNSYLKNKIKIEKLSKSYDNIEVIKDISISVDEGEFVSIVGPSGCGKTTIFNVLTNIEKYDTGEIEMNGLYSYMYQKDLLLPYKSIIDNVSLPILLKKGNKLKSKDKKNAREYVSKYFREFGLEGYEYKYPHELSGGMKQRASFLRTYIDSNDIMLLDEPFGALDSITKSSMQNWLLKLKDKVKPTILLITHDIEEAIKLSDKIYVISNKPSQVKKEYKINKSITDIEKFNLKNEILHLLN